MDQTKTTPKDFFLHLGATIVLYVAAGSLINLWFSIINYYRPDALAGYFYAGSVAWTISMLIVLVPILYIVEWLINRDIYKTPEKSSLWIRRWRIYLTLFLVVVLIGGDLIALINTYLNGEITSRFVYKVLAVLVVGGFIGKYYFFNLYSQFRLSKMARRCSFWGGILIVLVAIIVGFVMVGSPSKQRSLRFDEQRVSDLQNIQWQIINHWQKKGKLPAVLNELEDSISGYKIPIDPKDSSSYVYSVTGEKDFTLCATFALGSQDTKGKGEYRGGYSDVSYYPGPYGDNENWLHEKGRSCFERKIDSQLYPFKN